MRLRIRARDGPDRVGARDHRWYLSRAVAADPERIDGPRRGLRPSCPPDMLYSINLAPPPTFDELGDTRNFSFRHYDCACGGRDYRIVSTTTRHYNCFTVVQCLDCGTLRINPYLTEADTDRYYQEVYGAVKRKARTPETLYRMQSRDAAELAGFLRAHLAGDAARSVLDFGGGAGGRMDALLKAGFEIHLREPDEAYLAHGVSLGMVRDDGSRRHDCVVLSHVLEHVNHPVEFLRHLRQDRMTPRGLLYVEVPVLGWRRPLLRDLHIAHKFYFSLASLRHVCGLAGLAVVAERPEAGGLLLRADDTMAPASPEQLRQIKQASDRALRGDRLLAPWVGFKMLVKRFLAARR